MIRHTLLEKQVDELIFRVERKKTIELTDVTLLLARLLKGDGGSLADYEYLIERVAGKTGLDIDELCPAVAVLFDGVKVPINGESDLLRECCRKADSHPVPLPEGIYVPCRNRNYGRIFSLAWHLREARGILDTIWLPQVYIEKYMGIPQRTVSDIITYLCKHGVLKQVTKKPKHRGAKRKALEYTIPSYDSEESATDNQVVAETSKVESSPVPSDAERAGKLMVELDAWNRNIPPSTIAWDGGTWPSRLKRETDLAQPLLDRYGLDPILKTIETCRSSRRGPKVSSFDDPKFLELLGVAVPVGQITAEDSASTGAVTEAQVAEPPVGLCPTSPPLTGQSPIPRTPTEVAAQVEADDEVAAKSDNLPPSSGASVCHGPDDDQSPPAAQHLPDDDACWEPYGDPHLNLPPAASDVGEEMARTMCVAYAKECGIPLHEIDWHSEEWVEHYETEASQARMRIHQFGLNPVLAVMPSLDDHGISSFDDPRLLELLNAIVSQEPDAEALPHGTPIEPTI